MTSVSFPDCGGGAAGRVSIGLMHATPGEIKSLRSSAERMALMAPDFGGLNYRFVAYCLCRVSRVVNWMGFVVAALHGIRSLLSVLFFFLLSSQADKCATTCDINLEKLPDFVVIQESEMGDSWKDNSKGNTKR